ncbi:hypothetical protein KKH82_07475 [Patescibacteria group bacterium]|nr:hypothetical protein [Patescibacteria group bacterium]
MVVDCENVLYSHNVKESSKDVYNSVMVWNNSENICFSMGILESSMIFYSKYIKNSYNIWFSENLVGCQNCISCSDLENQSYCIQNKKYTKEEYLEKKEEILREKDRFIDYYKELKEPGKNY